MIQIVRTAFGATILVIGTGEATLLAASHSGGGSARYARFS
jgi:hypothetical protein